MNLIQNFWDSLVYCDVCQDRTKNPVVFTTWEKWDLNPFEFCLKLCEDCAEDDILGFGYDDEE